MRYNNSGWCVLIFSDNYLISKHLESTTTPNTTTHKFEKSKELHSQMLSSLLKIAK